MQYDMFGVPIPDGAPQLFDMYGNPIQMGGLQGQNQQYYPNTQPNQGYPNQGQPYPMPMQGYPNQGQPYPVQGQGYPPPMQGYPQPANHTYQTALQYDRYNQPVVKKRDVTEMVKDYIFQNTGIYVSNVIKIEDEPDILRHCCVESGISNLPKNNFSLAGTDVNTVFYFCKTCGNLYLPAYTLY